jgi:hypothetical protein
MTVSMTFYDAPDFANSLLITNCFVKTEDILLL